MSNGTKINLNNTIDIGNAINLPASGTATADVSSGNATLSGVI